MWAKAGRAGVLASPVGLKSPCCSAFASLSLCLPSQNVNHYHVLLPARRRVKCEASKGISQQWYILLLLPSYSHWLELISRIKAIRNMISCLLIYEASCVREFCSQKRKDTIPVTCVPMNGSLPKSFHTRMVSLVAIVKLLFCICNTSVNICVDQQVTNTPDSRKSYSIKIPLRLASFFFQL